MKKKSCWDTACGLLARRAHTRKELTQKLQLRKFPKSEIDETFERLESLHFLESDKSIAERHAKSLADKRGATPRWTKEKLLQRGIDPSTASSAANAAFEGWDEHSAALEFAGSEQDPRKAARRLERRGFSTDAVAHVVRHLSRAASNRDEG